MGYNTSVIYAQVFEDLRGSGVPVSVTDMWIAACAIEYGAPLLTYDAHFGHIPLLELVPVQMGRPR